MSAPWATCTAKDCTGVRLAGRYLCLAHADERSRSGTLARIGSDTEVDLRGVPLDPELLSRVLRALPVDQHRRPQWNSVLLDGATIQPGPPLDLAGHEFVERASWRGTRILRPVILREARLVLADFRDATFDEHVDAEGAVFAGCARFDDTRFRAGLTLDGARFDGGFDFRRASAPEILLDSATVNGPADLSLAMIGTLDLAGGHVSGDLVLDGAQLRRVVLTMTTVEGEIRDAGAEVARWEPAFTEMSGTLGAVVASAVQEIGQDGAPWRADLLGDAAPGDVRWVTVEEWVGHSELSDEADGPGYHGGVIGLQITRWPVIDDTGKPLFDEDQVRMVAVEADAFAEMLRVLLGEEYTPLRVGDVYAMRFDHAPDADHERPLNTVELRALGSVHATDITKEARDAAKAAYWSVLVPPLDAEADADVISAMTASDRGAR